MQRNSPELWDAYWVESPSMREDRYLLAREAHSIRWQRIQARILRYFPSFDGLEVVEIGAGAGTYAALMSQRGARVTVLDYSERALDRAREFFERLALPAEYVNADALALPEALLNHFDISMSFGLNEHFQGPQRLEIAQAHLDVLKPGGLTFISVPNRLNPPYRLFKAVAQRVGRWPFGEEYPFSPGELKALGSTLGCPDATVFGDALPNSLDFINPFKASAWVRKLAGITDNFDVARLRPERGTPLDSTLSYALVWSARKPGG